MDILEIMEDKAIDISKGNYRSVTRALTKGGYSKEVRHTSHAPSASFRPFNLFGGSIIEMHLCETALSSGLVAVIM
jgi:hypothetical protein